jgi:hypothetical protein
MLLAVCVRGVCRNAQTLPGGGGGLIEGNAEKKSTLEKILGFRYQQLYSIKKIHPMKNDGDMDS